ncbi:hypothetical protein UF75_4040 [Desulfosporosinus sp. I2]|uniref:DsrE family protein n=1 Tax=Desulfosporosinus sp. I2 TaxID=1617025 RepID=UPI0005EE6566|nr:DsrE family protein [Desulfosporosinus sp. I2]KJR45568.1 hypothetical protein UF75_4040 [Desulfosporosinus sp. I2]
MASLADKMLILKGERMGEGDLELGHKMMRGFLKMLSKQSIKPKSIFFLGDSVRLATKNSQVLEFLQQIQEDGVELLLCKAAVEWYQIEGEIAIGKVTSTGLWLERLGSLEVISL